MDENKCCENYASSYAKDMDSFCVREFLHDLAVCDKAIDHHVRIINGWTEITPDNIDEIVSDINYLVIATIEGGEVVCNMYSDWYLGLSSMAKYGGYYYYVLPKLNKEK